MHVSRASCSTLRAIIKPEACSNLFYRRNCRVLRACNATPLWWSASCTKTRRFFLSKATKRWNWYFFQKNSKNLLTSENKCSIIDKLTRREQEKPRQSGTWSLKIEQYEIWNTNLKICALRMKVFNSFCQNTLSITRKSKKLRQMSKRDVKRA